MEAATQHDYRRNLDMARRRDASHHTSQKATSAQMKAVEKNGTLRKPQNMGENSLNPQQEQERKRALQQKQRAAHTKLHVIEGGGNVRPLRNVPTVDPRSERALQRQKTLHKKYATSKKHTITLSSGKKAKIKEALHTIKLKEKAPFILAYTLAITQLFLAAYSTIAVAALGLTKNILATVNIIPALGQLIYGAISITTLALSSGIQLFIFFLNMCIVLYLAYFRWHYSTFLSRQIMKRFMAILILFLSLIPIVNLIPWSLVSLHILQNNLDKRAEKAKKFLKKNGVAHN